MFFRSLILSLIMLVFTFTCSFAQVMHIHIGENERVFDLANVDSITYVETVIDLSVEPEEIDFGEVAVGIVGEANLTVTNTGNGELIVNAFDFEEEVFEAVFIDPVSIRSGQSMDFRILFIPQDGGFIASNMIIQSNSMENPQLAVPLSGTGTREFIWEFVETGINMSVVINGALIANEPLSDGDYIGAFTPEGICAGFEPVGDEFPVGLSVYGAEQDQNNGFQAGEQLSFRIWDASTFTELETEFEVEDNGDTVYEAGGLIQVRINAIVE